MDTESVWDYPRPPKLEPFSKRIQIFLAGQSIVDSLQSMRVLETSHPPVYYIPQADIDMQYFTENSSSSFCEWKGRASYWDVQIGDLTVTSAAWSYANPTAPFAPLKDYIAFYANKMETCTVNGELVTPQPGNFYGGWITKNIVGPFKGEAGTMGW